MNTAVVLRSLERDGWRVFHDIEFDGFTVDHVAVGPSGVYAFETKNTSAHWNLMSTRDGQYLADAIDEARFGARKIRFLLAGVGEVAVTPLLICWGPGVGFLADREVDHGGVLVVAGPKALPVLRDRDREALDAFTAHCVAQLLEAYVRSRGGRRQP